MSTVIEILFFGKLADRIGRRIELPAPDSGATIADLRKVLAVRVPEARDDLLSPRLRACIGDALVMDDHPIDGVATIEFFPPLSGG